MRVDRSDMLTNGRGQPTPPITPPSMPAPPHDPALQRPAPQGAWPPPPPPPPTGAWPPPGYGPPPGSWPQPTSPAGGSSRTRDLVIAAVAVVGCLVVLLGVSVVVGTTATWDPALEPHVAFVEDARGLDFDHPVSVRRMTIEEAVATGELGTADTSWAEPYQILGLVPEDLQIAEAQGEVLAAMAAAYYDPQARQIVLPPGDLTIVDEATIIHELTHALQHQHGLLGPEWFDSGNAVDASRALVEGDADRIEWMWLAGLTAAEQAEFDRITAERTEGMAAVSNAGFLEAGFFQPYALGDPTVNLIVERWGVDELDRLMREGEATSELLFDPLGHHEGDLRAGPTPDLDGEVLWTDSLGPVVWYQVFAPTVGPEAAFDALFGYRYEEIRRYDDDGRACLAVTWWTDSTTDRDELRVVLDRVGARYDGLGQVAALEGQDWLSFDVCGPITDPSAQGPDVMMTLAAMAWVRADGEVRGLSDAVVSCAAPKVAAEFEVDFYDVETDAWATFVPLMERAIAECS